MEKQYTPGQRFKITSSEMLFTHGCKNGDDAIIPSAIVEVVKSRLKKKIRFKLIDGGFTMQHGTKIGNTNTWLPNTIQIVDMFDAYLDNGWINVEVEKKEVCAPDYEYQSRKDFIWMKLNNE